MDTMSDEVKEFFGDSLKAWQEHFSTRELNEIAFAAVYATSFNHGTAGHLSYTIIAKLAALLVTTAQQGQLTLQA